MMISVKSYLLDSAAFITDMILNIHAGGHPASPSEDETCDPMPTSTIFTNLIHRIL